MSIDAFTVAAQLINFLALLWLLNRFLYRPVQRAMAEREARDAERLAETARRDADAVARTQALDAAQTAFDADRERLQIEARAAADALHERLAAEARLEDERHRADARRRLDEDRTRLSNEIALACGDAVRDTVALALADLAGTTLQTATAHRLIDRLQTLPDDAFDAPAGENITITSAAPLEPAMRDRLAAALGERLGHPPRLDWRQDTALISGLELAVGGRRIGWHLAGYLDALATRVRDEIEATEERHAA